MSKPYYISFSFRVTHGQGYDPDTVAQIAIDKERVPSDIPAFSYLTDRIQGELRRSLGQIAAPASEELAEVVEA